MDLAGLRADKKAWVDAQLKLDTYLTVALPAALVVPQRTETPVTRTLTDTQIREISALYGQVIGAWAHYLESLRQFEAAELGKAETIARIDLRDVSLDGSDQRRCASSRGA